MPRFFRVLFGVIMLSIPSAPAETAGGPRTDTSTLTGKVMCGYQGWFACEGDGAERGWNHWTKGRGPLSPANAKIDLWPDVTGFGADASAWSPASRLSTSR